MTEATAKPGAGKARPDDHIVKARSAILKAALPNVAFDGWTSKVLSDAAEAAGVSHGQMRLAFPGGVVDLVDCFLADGDRRMSEALAAQDLSVLKIRERITLGVRTRIEVDLKDREAVRRAVTLLALPLSGTTGPTSLFRTVDAIWRAVGDTSTDFNFYTKRAILAGVYSTTCLTWFGDGSEDYADTWAFLDKRIADVMQIEKAKAGVKKIGAMLPDPFALLGWLRYRKS
ncbi:MAG: COQ9 family protein [Parvibaculaceae bacterium]